MSLLEVDEQGSGRSDSERETVNGKTFEGIDLKLTLEFLDRIVVNEGPLFES